MHEQLEELRQYRSKCKRFLAGHGARTAAEMLQEIPTDLGIDHYGVGGAVTALENEIQSTLGKPSAVFMPSGTMAQQIALRIHADRCGVRAIAFHPTCHLDIHEERAYQRLHNLVGVPVGDPRRLFTLDDLKNINEPLAAVLFELPQREIGGRLPSWKELQEQVRFVRELGVAVHLDGARLWECTPYYERTPAEICELFDTVYVSFYKGLGGLSGCCLAGDEDIIAEARKWRKRHGGGLYGLWPNAASGLVSLHKRLPRMQLYVQHAQAIAESLRGLSNVELVPDPPQTPMMHLHLRVDETAFLKAATKLAKEESVFTWDRTSPGNTPGVRIVEFTVGDATLNFAPDEVAAIIKKLVQGNG